MKSSINIPKSQPLADPLSQQKRDFYFEEIKRLFKVHDMAMVAHYYTSPEVQDLAQETGGCVADSLEMARFGKSSEASQLLVAGVRFMGETAKILSPDKRVFMPTLEAECSLDLGCPPEAFKAFCADYPDHEVVVYANTSAEVKAQSDWVVTSSIALSLVKHLHENGKQILWAPDRYLGGYIQKTLGIEMQMWDGSCIVHEEFSKQGLIKLKKLHPTAAILVHPESPEEVIDLADVVGSTSQLLKASENLQNDTFIVATDQGIFHQMRKASPTKTFIEAPTSYQNSLCRSCARCPWMSMNDIVQIYELLKAPQLEDNEIKVDPRVLQLALTPLERMIAFVP